MTDYELMKMVDGDILYAENIWANYSHDIEKLEELFNKIMFKYINIYEGISDGINVISQYERIDVKADTLRHNALILLDRLKAFKENGYKADGLYKKSLNDFVNKYPHAKYNPIAFNEVRIFINEDMRFSGNYKKEILEKIDEIEEICESVGLPEQKWERLRPYVLWISGKDVVAAVNILPLLNMIS